MWRSIRLDGQREAEDCSPGWTCRLCRMESLQAEQATRGDSRAQSPQPTPPSISRLFAAIKYINDQDEMWSSNGQTPFVEICGIALICKKKASQSPVNLDGPITEWVYWRGWTRDKQLLRRSIPSCLPRSLQTLSL